MPKNFLLLVSMLCAFYVHAGVKTTTVSGNWSSGSTWSTGSVPACGDSIVIAAGFTVTTTSSQDFSGCSSHMAMVIKGTLKFGNGDKYKFNCDTRFYVYSGGQIVSAGGGGNSNNIQVCGNTEWQAGDGTYSGPGCLPPSTPGCSAVLPVSLAVFEAENCSGNICLYWTTFSEKNNDYFELQRSYDGILFEPRSRVRSKAPNGNSTTILNYNVTDLTGSDASQVLYYRLKQVDIDRSFSYSRAVISEPAGAQETELLIAPNPSQGNFSIICKGLLYTSLQVKIQNSMGETVFETVAAPEKTAYTVFSPDLSLSAGVYICRLQMNNHETVKRIIVR